jgi:nucleotide-binding universal stress UspA family protein
MTIKPSDLWRDRLAKEAREVADGTLAAEEAFMARLFPESLLQATDTALGSFEAEVLALRAPADDEVFAVIKRAVLTLNAINEDHGGGGYETGEREELCEFIDRTLEEHGIDIPALATRNGIGAQEITDEWREW